MNKYLDSLTDYPFEFLSRLLKNIDKTNEEIIGLHIGEPKGDAPPEALQAINDNFSHYSKYPTSKGDISLREAYSEWLLDRFKLKNVDPNKNVLPISGSREGLFSFIQSAIDSTKPRPIVIIPNPFYKIYEGAALMAGAEPYFVNSQEDENFKTDFDSIPEEIWKNCQLLILCSPSNPTGNCLEKSEYERLIEKAISYDFLICSDECYVDIYESSTEPPIGILECEDITLPKSKSVVFHSLSKRSNLAGLRSGFVSAGEEVIEKLGLYRTYHGVTLPIPSQIASEWAWKDRKHVEENRRNYDQKYKTAISCFESVHNIQRPQGGFYIWLKVPCNDEDFVKTLYEKESVLALPGSYLGKEEKGINPGKGYVRLAVVHDTDTIAKAFTAVNRTLSAY